jgi:hypothetical protein
VVIGTPIGFDTFTPALLIRKDNPALRTLLELFGATVENDPVVVEALPLDWQVNRFDQYGMARDTGTVDLSSDPDQVKPFLAYKKDVPSVILPAPAEATRFGPRNLITLSESPRLEISTPPSSIGAEFKLTFVFKEVALADEKINMEDLAIDISYNVDDKGIEINKTKLKDPERELKVSKRLTLLFEEDEAANQVMALDVTIPGGSYKHKPLIQAIAESTVAISWDTFVIRLRKNYLGLVAPKDDPGTPLATATFRIPLILAEVGPEAANALAKLIPVEAGNDNVLLPLEFTVQLKRPEGWTDIDRVLWAFEPATNFTGQIQKSISKLLALFKSDDTNTFSLSNLFAPLEELNASVGSAVSFAVEKLKDLDPGDNLLQALNGLKGFNTEDFPLPVAVRMEGSGNEFLFLAIVRLNLWKGRLADNRIYFYLAKESLPPLLPLATGELDPKALLDLTAFAVEFPARSVEELVSLIKGARLPDEDPIRPGLASHDGYLDMVTSDLVIDLKGVNGNDMPIRVLFPGDIKDDADLKRGRRVVLLLEDFDPGTWPENGTNEANKLKLRLGTRGLTFKAKADTTRAALIPVPNAPDDADVSLKLVESRDGVSSGLVVIDNQIRYADIGGRLAVPGFENLEADVRLGLRRDQPKGPPVVTAVIDLDRSDRQPLARLKVPYLKAQLDDLCIQLTWRKVSNRTDWDLRAWASGAISLVNEVQSTGGVSQLDQPRAIPFLDLDLTKLHLPSFIKFPLGRAAPPNGEPVPSRADVTARFELLDGQFLVEFTQAELSWNVEEKKASLRAERAQFAYLAASGEYDVAIDAGEIRLDIKSGSLSFGLAGYLGLQVHIGQQITFAGGVGWVDTAKERCFLAQGQLLMTGFTQVDGVIKLGTGVKADGSIAPNVALFGELPFEAELFAGVVMKRLGLGLGVNNQLAALGPNPDSRTILANLDRIDPKEVRNWSFVTTKGVYVSVVATATLTANRGKANVVSAYVAKLVLSIDTNLDIVAAGRVWLFSSEDFVNRPDHAGRPTLVAAADFKPRAGSLQLVAETGPRPAIEANPMLGDLLSRVRARFSFYLSPDLADYYLEELSYRDTIFGISVLAAGSYRIAIGRFGALITAQLSLRGDLPERKLIAGPGGFTFSGALSLDAGYGGVVSLGGFAAYGFIRATLTFNVSAFVLIPTVEFQLRYYVQVFSITVSIPYLSCKRWRCKWKTREIKEEVVVRIPYVVPVIRIEECHLPPTSLDLLLEGAVAFDESGGFGFSGTIAISTVICGMPLRIAPRFDFRPDLVASVRRRVAAVEDRINQLRGIPRQQPPAPLLAVADEGLPLQETWYHYTSQQGDQVLHLLVPSPDQPTWWYTPRASDVVSYANLPRDTATNSQETGSASDRERKHLSPFRSAVMRMVLPFVDKDGNPTRVVDLAMPWDRANYDALPDETAGLSDDERIALVMALTQIEASFLDTSAIADNPTPINSSEEKTQWKRQEDDPNRIPLSGVEVVSDPRPETGARSFWTLTDQMTRPEGVLPFRYRPVSELVAEGFAGLEQRGARRDDIGRLLRYEQVRALAARQNRYDDKRPARRLAQARATLLSSILADFARDGGPQTYGPIEPIKLVRKERDHVVIARRRTGLRVLPEPEGDTYTYTARLTLAILENSTDLDLGSTNTWIFLNITWDLDGENPKLEPNVKVPLPGPDDSEDRVLILRHQDIAAHVLAGDLIPGKDDIALLPPKRPLKVLVERIDPNSADALGAPKSALLVFEAVPPKLQNVEPIRQVGLFAVTSANEQLRLDGVRIIRNELNTLDSDAQPADWAQEASIRVISMNQDEDPVQSIQARVFPLEPTQEFQEAGDGVGARVRVKLPISFEESLLRSDLPRLKGFEIYRQLSGDLKPVKVAECVPPQLQVVDEADRKVLLVEPFQFGEDLPVERDEGPSDGRFTGPAGGNVPNRPVVHYFLRALLYGRTLTDAQLIHWKRLDLYIPPRLRQLPPLGLIIPVEKLIEPADAAENWHIPVHLVDRSPATYQWPEGGWHALEIWAEPERIRSSGPYAVTEETPVTDPGSAQVRAIREPGDISAERLPRANAGMVKLGVITKPKQQGDPAIAELKVPRDGRALIPGRAYRLFVRPELEVDQPLVEPLALHLIRDLPGRVDAATPTLPVDRLELVARDEENRILYPIEDLALTSNAWIKASLVAIQRLTRDSDPFERFRFLWQHPGELDAGVEILTQDRDESHQVGRMLVTVQEEAVFQMALRDFRTPALWRSHPEAIERGASKSSGSWPTCEDIAANTPSTSIDLTPLILWRDERNPAIERVRRARAELKSQLETFNIDPTDNDDWVPLFVALREYLAALRAYQRTPLAPDAKRDRVGLEVLLLAARATLMGLNSGIPDKKDNDTFEDWLAESHLTLEAKEQKLKDELKTLAAIDLSTMTVADTPEDYKRIKADLVDIDLARKLAAIVRLRLELADDLLDPNLVDEDIAQVGRQQERLPGFVRWKALVKTYQKLREGNAPRTKALLNLFGDDGIDDTSPADGQSGAKVVLRLIGEDDGSDYGVQDPSELLYKTTPPGNTYQILVRTFVPQAAGLTAAIDTLGRDAKTREWTLVRRPHHQLGTSVDEVKGRSQVKTELRDLLPSTQPAPSAGLEARGAVEPGDDALIIPFANLLERLGLAVDLAVIDKLNQPLSQASLLEWIGGQAWDAVRASIGPEDKVGYHDIVVVTGREPDTDRDLPQTSQINEDQSLGYAFVKLVVVPRSLMAALFGRQVDVEILSAEVIEEENSKSLKVTFAPTVRIKLIQAGLQRTISLIYEGKELPSFELSSLANDVVTIQLTEVPPIIPPSAVAKATSRLPDDNEIKKWLEVRGIKTTDREDVNDLILVRQMAKAWWQGCTSLNSISNPNQVGEVIVETRGRRWATVPALGSWAHIDWEAPDAAGREILVAARRVSRYEALLRWARGAAVPVISRLPSREGANMDIIQALQWRRRIVGPPEEPETLPVLISQHPTRIDFIVALPTSGARATVSGLSRRRNGYRDLAAQFGHRRIKPVRVDLESMLQKIQSSKRLFRLTIQSTAGARPLTWSVQASELTEDFDKLVVFVSAIDNPVRALISNSFVRVNENRNEGVLTLLDPNPDAQLPDFVNSKVMALMLRDASPEPTFDSIAGSIGHIHDNQQFRIFSLKSDSDQFHSDKVEYDPRAYQGQVILIYDDNAPLSKPDFARIIQEFNPVNQELLLSERLPDSTNMSSLSFRMFLGAPTVRREQLPTARAIADQSSSDTTDGSPTLFRHERLLSLTNLPYYREYTVAVQPRYDVHRPERSRPPQLTADVVSSFARRPAALLATYPAAMTSIQNGNKLTYTFRITLPRQGDLLTPTEALQAGRLDRDDLVPWNSPVGEVLSNPLRDAELPELGGLYQILWRIQSPTESGDIDPVFVQLVDVVLPGHSIWTPPADGSQSNSYPIQIINRSTPPGVVLRPNDGLPNDGNVNGDKSQHIPLRVWQPTAKARPVYEVSFQVLVTTDDPTGKLFANNKQAFIQAFHSGRPSRAIPIGGEQQ